MLSIGGSTEWSRSRSSFRKVHLRQLNRLSAVICYGRRVPDSPLPKPFARSMLATQIAGNQQARLDTGSEAAMTVKLYAFTCGTVTGEFGRLMEGGEGDITLPVPVFLIEHPKGRALFDTGLHPDCQRDPARRLGTRLAGLFRIGFQPGEEVSARLEAIDRDPGTIDLVINSHFHFDHVGGNALIRNATMLVQRREWDAGMARHRGAARLQPARFRPRSQIAPGRWRARRVRRRLGRVPADARAHARAPVAPGETRRR